MQGGSPQGSRDEARKASAERSCGDVQIFRRHFLQLLWRRTRAVQGLAASDDFSLAAASDAAARLTGLRHCNGSHRGICVQRKCLLAHYWVRVAHPRNSRDITIPALFYFFKSSTVQLSTTETRLALLVASTTKGASSRSNRSHRTCCTPAAAAAPAAAS